MPACISRFVTCFTMFWVLTPVVLAVDEAHPWNRRPRLGVPILPDAPTIDGEVTERAWVGALKTDHLIVAVSGQIDPERTEAFIGYTQEKLYIAWRVYRDWDGPLLMAVTDPGREQGRAIWRDDGVEIFLDPSNTRASAITFAGNAVGAYNDGRVSAGTDVEPDWVWDYAARVTDFGWEGELAVTFESLGLEGAPETGTAWGFDFVRNNKSPHDSVSMLSYRSEWHDRSRYGDLIFAGAAPALRILDMGAIGDTSIGLHAELVNLHKTARSVTIDYGLYRRPDSTSPFNFLEEIDSGLSNAGQDVDAFTTVERQIAQLLNLFEVVDHKQVTTTVDPDSRTPLLLTTANAPAGGYIIAYTATDADEQPLMAGLVPAMRSDPIEVAVVPYFLEPELLDITLSLHTQAMREQAHRVRMRLLQDEQVVAEDIFDAGDTRESVTLRTDDLQPGAYRLDVVVYDDAGKAIGQLERNLYRPEPPRWTIETPGTRAFVPQPWTPVEADVRQVAVWGRTYQFGDSFLPAQITTQEEPLFAEAPRLIVHVDGRPAALEGELALQHAEPEYADYRFTGTAGSIPLTADVRVEFDGFITVDLVLETAGVIVDRLFLEFPFHDADAQLYTLHSYFDERRGTDVSSLSAGLNRSGRIGAGFSIGFNHAVWLGTPSHGFQWCAETAEHWHHQDPSRVIDVEQTGEGQTTFRLRVIDKPTEAERLSYRWGFVASPTRPYQPGGHDLRYLQLNYPHGYPDQPAQREKVESYLASARPLNPDWVGIFSQWNLPEFFGQPYREAEDVEDRAALAQRIKREGFRVVYYTGWNGLHPNMQMWPFYGEAMRRVPTRFSYGGYKECTYGGYTAYLTNGAVWLAEKLGAEGVYLDSTPGPEPCLNAHHGCGFVSPASGARIVTRDIWGRREMMKRLYKIFHGEIIDAGLVYGHDGRPPLLAITSFLDVYHTGEGAEMKDYEDLDFYLAQYNPTQYGTAVQHAWRNHHPVPRNFAWGVALLHDNRLKMYPGPATNAGLQRTSYDHEDGIDWRMWVPVEWFDWDQDPRWHPYHANHDLLSVSGERVHASFHHNDANQIIFNAMNMDPDAQETEFQFDLARLGLPRLLHARDVVTHETWEIRDGAFTLTLPGRRPRVLLIDVRPVPTMAPGVDE